MSNDPQNETWWREYLLRGHTLEGPARFLFPRLPSSPRCKVCYAPFGGIGGALLRPFGWEPSRKNPRLCARCCERLPAGGIEMDIAVFFADVRGYTSIAEKIPPTQLAQTMKRFYDTAIDTVIAFDGLVDKLLGDAVMALFVPGIAGAEYRAKSMRAAERLMRDIARVCDPPLPIGIGISAGLAYVGNLGSDQVVDLTAIGDTVNVASRLQAGASAGEILIVEELAPLAQELFGALETRTVLLKGKEQPVVARVLRPK
ncbi:MAG: adenylate/guanylate cyclase domain-containing protein [Chloroflexi bacterium]|nr:adenylate/guanylate cyclase domain-containing protein [Chloroflexota bacterium]